MRFVDSISRNLGRTALLGVLAALMIVGLAACGSTTGATGDSTPDQSAAAAPTNTPAGDMAMEEPTQAPDANAQAIPTQAATTDQSSSGAVTQVDATLIEWAINLSKNEVPAGNVQFNVTNAGQMGHNFTVLDSTGAQLGQTPMFRASEGVQTLQLDLKAGTYTIICSLPGHAQRGQQTQIVVK